MAEPPTTSPQPIECERVDLDFLTTAPCIVTVNETMAATPGQLFDVFQDADSWSKFAFPITDVEWTSPFPIEVGSTRTVTMRAGLVGWEEFLAWEPNRRMAFRFNQTVKGGPGAFAEDYLVTELASGRTHLEWTMAMRLTGVAANITPVIKGAMWTANRLMLRRLRNYVESGPTLAPRPDQPS